MKTFTQKVYEVVKKIPKGKVLSYKQVAQKAGSPAAHRAVGTVLSKNYNADIPCHRVIRTNGELGNYNRGARQKKALLTREGYAYSRGVTILEVLVVVVIITILAGLIYVNATEARQKGRNAARIADIQQIAKAIDAYVVEHNKLPPLPTGSSVARPGIASTDIEEGASNKFGWDEFMQTIGLNPMRDPLNGRQVPGAQNIDQALWQYSYIVGLDRWTYDPDNNEATHNHEYYDGEQLLPAVYARLEGGARPDTPICTDGPIQSSGPLGAPTGSGYGSTNCTDLRRGCLPSSSSPLGPFGEDPVICVLTGYSSLTTN